MQPDKRWDTDPRGRGIADGGWMASDVRRFLGALGDPGWVAEEPDAHLLPHLRRACEASGSPWTLRGTTLRDDGVYVVDLLWADSAPRFGRLRADAVALLGAIAENDLFVRQQMGEGVVEFRATTGMLDGDGPFKGHGHLLLLHIGGPVVERLLSDQEVPLPPSSDIGPR